MTAYYLDEDIATSFQILPGSSPFINHPRPFHPDTDNHRLCHKYGHNRNRERKLKCLSVAGCSARKLRKLATGYPKKIFTGSAENVPAYRRCNEIVRFVTPPPGQ
jgi:hypothetical protein